MSTTHHLNAADYQRFIDYYADAKPTSIRTIGNRVSRIYRVMRESVHLAKYATSDGFLDIHAMTETDFIRLITIMTTKTVESKKQIVLTLRMLAQICRCETLLTSPLVAEHMNFIVDESIKSRQVAANAENLARQYSWDTIIARARTNILGENHSVYSPRLLLNMFILHCPPLRIAEYQSIEIQTSSSAQPAGGKNHLILPAGHLIIADHMARSQFASVYGKDGVRQITLAPALTAYINATIGARRNLFEKSGGKKYSTDGLYKMFHGEFGASCNELRAAYLHNVVKPMANKRERLAVLYMKGKTSM